MAKVKTKKIRKAATPPTPAFEATPERLAQAVERDDDGMVIAEHMKLEVAKIERAGQRALLVRRFADTYVDRLLRTKKISYAQWYAADWYREVYELAGIEARVSANYGGSGVGECSYGMAVTERQARARQRLRGARACFPSHMVALLDRIILHDMVPALQGGVQRTRFAARLGKALQPLAEWINAPTTA